MGVLGEIVIFSIVEVVILTVWLALLRLGTGLPVATQAVAAGVLLVGLIVEHVIAYNVGRGAPPFSIPR